MRGRWLVLGYVGALHLGLDARNAVVPARIAAVPRATAESREALAKLAGKAAEASKARARGLRKKYMSKIKIPPPEGMSEDEVHKLRKRVQEITDDCVKQVDELLEKKQAAIRQV